MPLKIPFFFISIAPQRGQRIVFFVHNIKLRLTKSPYYHYGLTKVPLSRDCNKSRSRVAQEYVHCILGCVSLVVRGFIPFLCDTAHSVLYLPILPLIDNVEHEVVRAIWMLIVWRVII